MTKMQYDDDAAEVLAHSNDDDEWNDEPVTIEKRPSGSQVISARLPETLATRALNVAAARGLSPSQFVREALEKYLAEEHQSLPAVYSIEDGRGVLSSRRLYGSSAQSWLKEEPAFAPVFVSIGADTQTGSS